MSKQSACSNLYYPAGNKPVYNSNMFVNIASKIGNIYFINETDQRPFVPYVGYVAGMDGILVPDTVAHHQTFIAAFLQWFEMGFFASRNYVNENLVLLDQINDGDNNYFASYLFKKLNNNNTMQVRYYQTAQLIQQFWKQANVGWTIYELVTQVQNLADFLIKNSDANLFIAPAQYRESDVAPSGNDSGLGATLKAWKIASADFVGFGAIEASL